MLRISNIRLSLNDEESELERKIIKKLRIKKEDLKGYTIHKKSIDARRKDDINFNYTVDVDIRNEEVVLRKIKNGVTNVKDTKYEFPKPKNKNIKYRPIIVGTGSSGLFSGLMLSRMGYGPILLERGDDVDTRTKKVNKFWTNGKLDTESNVQFGEGGAGTFSDGKLTTLINDKRCRFVLEEFVKAGAPSEIIYTNKPHIGTDILKEVVKNIRNEIIKNGGEVRFNSKVTDFIIKDNKIQGLVINDSEEIRTDKVLLGIGHSARDTFDLLYKKGVNIIQKPFSIGVRIEHSQEFINIAQYGKYYKHDKLGAADYKLSYHSKNGRSAYTFCMCPGGYVVAAASEKIE